MHNKEKTFWDQVSFVIVSFYLFSLFTVYMGHCLFTNILFCFFYKCINKLECRSTEGFSGRVIALSTAHPQLPSLLLFLWLLYITLCLLNITLILPINTFKAHMGSLVMTVYVILFNGVCFFLLGFKHDIALFYCLFLNMQLSHRCLQNVWTQ